MSKINFGNVTNDLALYGEVEGIAGDGKSELAIRHYLSNRKRYALVLTNYSISEKPIILYITEDRSQAEISQIASIFVSLVRQ